MIGYHLDLLQYLYIPNPPLQLNDLLYLIAYLFDF